MVHQKAKYIIFITIIFVIPWLFIPLLSAKPDLQGLHPFNYYMMLLPATGIIIGDVFTKKKTENKVQWIYISAFLIFTVLVFLWGIKVMEYDLLMHIENVLLCIFSLSLFLFCCLGEQKETPAYRGKNVLSAVGIFVLIEVITMLFSDFQLQALFQIIFVFIWSLVNAIITSAVMLYGEEYAWRGHLLGRFQRVFGKRTGVILLGLLWEFWHLPVFIIMYQSGEFDEMIGFSFGIFLLLRVLNTVSLAVFLGWAYTKTENLWCCILIHGINNGLTGSGAMASLVMDTVPPITLIRPVILMLFLFTKEYRKK